MATLIGSVRRLAMAPSMAEVTFAHRGFPGQVSSSAARLESIPQSVVCGFEWGIDSRSQWEVERRLETMAPELRGFGYEGATMAYTIRDSFTGFRGTRTRDLLNGPGLPHIFLTYIGIGFAMARLPRPLWAKIVPELERSPYYPTMTWLAVDGFGFDRAYFQTKKWIDQQFVPEPYPWEGNSEYFLRAVDQGIGRALWFIHGADAAAATAHARRFAVHRQADLFSGIGLAAVFAGGAPPEALAAMSADASDDFAADLATGSILAIKARDYSGHVPAFAPDALEAMTGLSVAEAVALADRLEVAPGAPGAEPAYELWRRAIRAHFAAHPAPVAIKN